MSEDFPPKAALIVTWDQVHRNSRDLAARLLDEVPGAGGWKGIVAITRGGMVPAAVLAREMGLRLIETLAIASYDEQNQGRVRVLKAPETAAADDGNGWLLVDDLVDTGATARAAREMLPGARFVTLYAKPRAAHLTDMYIHRVDQATWVHFPWDTKYAEDADAPGRLVYVPPLYKGDSS